jgi:hypothetical protein
MAVLVRMFVTMIQRMMGVFRALAIGILRRTVPNRTNVIRMRSQRSEDFEHEVLNVRLAKTRIVIHEYAAGQRICCSTDAWLQPQ